MPTCSRRLPAPRCAPSGQPCQGDGDCASVTNGTVTCAGGTRTLACSYGWGDCNGKGDCATNVLTTASNCGTCGTPCSAYCVNGTCNDRQIVATGDDHVCAVLADGSVWCWGDDVSGQLGDAPTPGKNPVPKKVAGLPVGAICDRRRDDEHLRDPQGRHALVLRGDNPYRRAGSRRYEPRHAGARSRSPRSRTRSAKWPWARTTSARFRVRTCTAGETAGTGRSATGRCFPCRPRHKVLSSAP